MPVSSRTAAIRIARNIGVIIVRAVWPVKRLLVHALHRGSRPPMDRRLLRRVWPVPATEFIVLASRRGAQRIDTVPPTPDEMKRRPSDTHCRWEEQSPVSEPAVQHQRQASHREPFEDLA